MVNINEISPEQIERLKDLQLTQLLRKLLYLEAFKYNIPSSGVSAPLNITVPDGGEDGRIEWSDGLEKTNWIPNRFTLYQIKATDMEPAKCKTEIIASANKLKPKVEEVFDKNGTYILFHNYSLNKKQIDERIEKFREGLKEAGKTYFDIALIEIYDAHKITAWVNEYPSVVVFVLECLNIQRNKIFKTWQAWEKYFSADFSYSFVRTPTIEDYLKNIYDAVNKDQGNLRIVGLSGLGKTRLLLEAFRIDDLSNFEKLSLNHSVLYCDAKDFEWSTLKASVNSLTEQDSKGILVVDNCELSIHKKLIKELRNSKIILITLNFDPEDIDEDSSDPLIILKPNQFSDLIPKLLSEVFPGINDPDTSRIKEFSQGFPLMTILLGKGKTDGKTNLGKLTDKELIERLLGIDNANDEIKKVLCACSIFESFGYDGDLINQRNYIATKLSHISGTDQEKMDKFYEICQKYISRGILEKSGRRVFIKPKPLALTLAAEWWNICRDENVTEIFEDVKNNNLTEHLCRQMSKLDFLPKAQELAENLCGKTGPFGQAEVLNTEEGSRIFRSLVEVNPQATVIALERAFGSFSKEQLFEIKAGRRNLVWALEKLCFRKETFYSATKILFSLALAENENYGNNATSQFVQLFLIILSGTETDLKTRLELLKELISRNNTEELTLIFKALKAGLNTMHFARMSGAENQGSGLPLRDFHPNKSEVIEYQKEILQILQTLLNQNPEYLETIEEIISDSIRQVAHIGNFNLMETLIRDLIKQKEGFAPELAKSLKLTYDYEANITQTDKTLIEELMKELEPKNLENRIKMSVTNSLFDLSDEKSKSKNKAEKLAVDLVNNVDWFNYLRLLYEGNQQHGLSFGKTLASLSTSEFAQSFVEESLKVLKEIPIEVRNYDILVIFLSVYKNQDLNNQVLETIISENTFLDATFSFYSKFSPDLNTLLKLFTLREERNLPFKNFLAIKWGTAFYNLNPDDQLLFIKKLSEFGLEGVWLSISMIRETLNDDKNNLNIFSDFLTENILKEDFLLNSLDIDPNFVSDRSWKDLILRLIKDDEKNISKLTNQIIEFLKKQYKFGRFTQEVSELINYLFEYHFENEWSSFGETLLTGDSAFYLSFKDIVQAENGITFKHDGILFKLKNQDLLLDWCRKNLPDSARYIAGMMPVYKLKEVKKLPDSHLKENEIDKEDPLHPFAKNFIAEFGDDDLVLSEFSAKLGSYGYVGSGLDMLNIQKKVWEDLQNHSLLKVREWSKKEIPYLNDAIKETKIYEDERFM